VVGTVGPVGQVQIAPVRYRGICGIAQAHFLGKVVGVEPVNEPFSPARDDCGLGVVYMGVHKSRADQRSP